MSFDFFDTALIMETSHLAACATGGGVSGPTVRNAQSGYPDRGG